jgi:hypothetical protein
MILYELNNNEWEAVSVKAGKYNPDTPAGSYNYSFTYQGTAGKTYYAYSSFYAKDAEGETTRDATSFNVKAT